MKCKLSALSAAIIFSTAVSATTTTSEGIAKALANGELKISGDAELNINYRDHETTGANYKHTKNGIDQDGRILIQFAGETELKNGYYAGFKAQPLIKTSGDVAVDDAYAEFGRKGDWSARVGRFEGYDMSPKPLDVFVEYGDGSNSSYNNSSVYSYQMAEARGRGSDGQLMVNKHFGPVYMELGFMLGDKTEMFTEGSYHDKQIDTAKSKDNIVVRPVISYQIGQFNLSAGAETSLIQDAVVDVEGNDISQRNGYAAKLTWANDNFTVNGTLAYMDAHQEINQTASITASYKDIIGLGYIHSINEYDNENWRVGDANLGTFYASYALRNVMDIQNFSMLFGGYYTHLENKLTTDLSDSLPENNDIGARIRLTYTF